MGKLREKLREKLRNRYWVRGLSLMSLSLILGGCLDGDLDGGKGINQEGGQKGGQNGYEKLEPATWYYTVQHIVGFVREGSSRRKKLEEKLKKATEETKRKDPLLKNHPYLQDDYGNGRYIADFISDEEGILNHQLKINSDKTMTWKIRTGDKEKVENKGLDRVVASYSYNFEGSLIDREKGRRVNYKKFELKTRECNEENYPELLRGDVIPASSVYIYGKYKREVITNSCQDGKARKYLMAEVSDSLDEYLLVIFNVHRDQESKDKYPTLGEVRRLLSEKYSSRGSSNKELRFENCVGNTCFIRFERKKEGSQGS